MIRKIYFLLILFTALNVSGKVSCQKPDSTTFLMYSRYSFYSFEKRGEMLLHSPQSLIYNNLTIIIKINNDTVGTWKGMPGKKILRIPVNVDLFPGDYKAAALIVVPGLNKKYVSYTGLRKLNYKSNEVKTDRLTGGLIVNKRPFFPFGFYCYSPVYPTLPEEEVVKGFNMISPYQVVLPGKLSERQAYMDRCAGLGMKVHYNLLSVSGGGGVGSKINGLDDKEKKKLLLNEIETFRDHPALLAWYIADEPNGYKIPPDTLINIYRIIKETDPWHPVSIVFMAPFMSSKAYSDALDIVMADPYPVPDSPVTLPGDVAASLSGEFRGKRPVWMVPQTFGGGELWQREPTYQEIRAMTYHSVINGARGIQYFVRQGLNLFPKSVAAWGECGKMAVEIAEMTPWLLSDEESIPVRSSSQNILATTAVHNGQLLILTVNKTNAPQPVQLSIAKPFSGRLKVLFENRNINVSDGNFSDYISAFGSQAYLLDMKLQKDTLTQWSENMLRDPGFEIISSAGVPSACYAWNEGDRGSTYFLDSQEHVEGNHSLRLITPKENAGARLRFFPVPVLPGRSYLISVWAKADTERRSSNDIKNNKSQIFEISLGNFGNKRFATADEWQQFVTSVTIPVQDDLPAKMNILLKMPSRGVAWFDLLQIAELTDIKHSINPELQLPWEIVW